MIFNVNSSSNLRPVNEVYFGKTKDIQKIENALDHFRNKYMGQYFVVKVNQDPELLAINRMFEKYFGFGCFSLTINNQVAVNAYTIPIDARIDVNSLNATKTVIADKDGFKFDPKMDYCCMVYMYSGFIFNEAYTTEEIMACILHEIGHNFYASLNTNHGIMASIFKVFVFLAIIQGNIQLLFNGTNTISSAVKKLEQKLTEEKSLLIDIRDNVRHVINIFKTINSIPVAVLNVLTFNGLTALGYALDFISKVRNPLNLIFLPKKISDEKTADNFANMYGYGPALSSAFIKMDSSKTHPSKIMRAVGSIPFISALYNLVPLPTQILATAFDEHPEGIYRAKDQLRMLQREANKEDLDPKMKKVILADIQAINKQIDMFMDNSQGLKDPDWAKHTYNKLLNELDMGDILSSREREFKSYDDVYNDRNGKS